MKKYSRKNCLDRKEKCHVTCKKYLEEKELYRKEAIKRSEEVAMKNAINQCHSTVYRRGVMRKRKNCKRNILN